MDDGNTTPPLWAALQRAEAERAAARAALDEEHRHAIENDRWTGIRTAERDAARKALRYAKAVATIWRDAGLVQHAKGVPYAAFMTHPLALVLAALDGETDPAELGCDPDDLALVLHEQEPGT